MQILKELATFLHQFRRQKIDVLNYPGKKKNLSKPEEFYQLLLDDNIADEDAIAKALGYEGKQTGNYRRLKTKVEAQMLDTVLFLNPKYFSKEKAVRIKCYRDLLIMKIFTYEFINKIAVKLGKRALSNAQQHDFEDIAMEVCYYLRRHYGLREYDYKKFIHYNELYHQYKEERDGKELADEYRIRLIHLYRRGASDEEILSLKDSFYNDLDGILEKSTNINLHLLAFYIQSKSFEMIGDHKKSLKVVEDFIIFLETKRNVRRRYLEVLYNQKLMAHVKLGEYEQGLRTVLLGKEYFKKLGRNWYVQQFGIFLLSLHSQNYDQAYSLYSDLNKTKFKNASPRMKERWLLYRAYLQYLIAIGKIKPKKGGEITDKFRLAKFLNNVPELSKDKSVHNIAILVIHFLFLVQQKKYDDAIDRVDALKKYLVRYIKRKKDLRSNIFIKMLIKITDANFHSIRAKKHAQPLLKQLKAESIDKANQDYDIEIIPYEHLWAMAMASLEERKKGT